MTLPWEPAWWLVEDTPASRKVRRIEQDYLVRKIATSTNQSERLGVGEPQDQERE